MTHRSASRCVFATHPTCSVGGVRLQQVDIRRLHPRARTGRVDVSAYGFRGNLAAGNWSLCNRVDHGNLYGKTGGAIAALFSEFARIWFSLAIFRLFLRKAAGQPNS